MTDRALKEAAPHRPHPPGFILALLPGKGEESIIKRWQSCSQDVKAKPAFKRKITAKRRSSPNVRNTNEFYSDLWVHMNTDL